MDTKIRIALLQDIPKIIEVADTVFKQHYAQILTAEQIDYMYEKTYTVDALTEQMKSGTTFFLYFLDNVPLGFMAYYFKEDNNIYLSKLYVNTTKQKSGIGNSLFAMLENIAIKNHCNYIELNVHRKNPAMYFYKKLGFELFETTDIPFGKFWLNDYVLRKSIKQL
jgi:GNAT superfamily N-acetyltransferase